MMQKLKNTDNRGLRLATGLAEGGETGYSLFSFYLISILSFIFITRMDFDISLDYCRPIHLCL